MATNPVTEAEQILDGTWTAIAGSRYIPVDPAQIASKLGISVFPTTLERNISGAIIKKPGVEAQILLNSEDAPNRQRFTCAHELGHFIKRSDNPDAFEYIDYRGPEASTGANPEEVFANTFAANLLMPEKELRAAYADVQSTVVLADRFGVSNEAMVYRIQNLHL